MVVSVFGVLLLTTAVMGVEELRRIRRLERPGQTLESPTR